MAKKSDSIESKKCITPEFRVSFPNVFKPAEYEDSESEPKYGLTMIFDKSIDLKMPAKDEKNSIRRIVRNAIVEKWGEDKSKWPKKMWNPIRDGDEDNDREDESLFDAFYIRANSKTKPGLVDPRLRAITTEDTFYPGCYARAEVLAYAFEKKGNRGVALTVLNIQKTRDGDPLSGRRHAADVFSSIESDDGDEDPSDEDDDEYSFD